MVSTEEGDYYCNMAKEQEAPAPLEVMSLDSIHRLALPACRQERDSFADDVDEWEEVGDFRTLRVGGLAQENKLLR